jgi:alkylation response protein AidB-like acyl-CoA dehydrogenase
METAVVFEEAGRACLPGPLLSTTLGNAISPSEKKSTVAILEKSASWDLDAVRMRAVRNRDAYVLDGEKLFVNDADVAEVILCVVRDGDDLVVLPVERGSVSVRRTPSLDETRTTCAVTFETVSVDQGKAIRGPLQRALDIATVALCAEMVGGMQWILDTTVDYAKSRQQFGRAIGSFQAVQHQCADMLLMTESARSATYYAAWALGENDPAAPLAVSIAKAYCSDAAREVANRGVQVHGGIGFTWEHDLQLYYRRAKASETLFGDATFHRERIARLIVDQPRKDASDLVNLQPQETGRSR